MDIEPLELMECSEVERRLAAKTAGALRSFRALTRVVTFGLVLCAGALTAGAEPAPTTALERELWNELVKLDSNSIVSPLGAEIALEVLASGARGVTRTEILDSIGGGGDASRWCDAVRALNKRGVQHSVDVSVHRGASPDASTLRKIGACNGAVRTTGRGDLFRIVDAVSLRSLFVARFQRASTHPGAFYGKHRTADTPLMTECQFNLEYAKIDSFDVIALPLAQGFQLYLAGSSERAAVPRTPDAFFQSFSETSRRQYVCVTVPRLHLTGATDLGGAFTRSGIRSVQTPGDFRGFGLRGPIRARQESHLRLDEDGIDASSTTIIRVPLKLNVDPKIVRIRYDHPFWLFIRENAGQTTLFSAHVADATDR